MRTPILILMSAIGVIGANSLLLSPVVTAVSETLEASTTEVMRAASAYGLGVAAAALLLAPMADRIGAGRLLRAALMLLAAGLAASAAAADVWWLMAAQAVCGLAAGAALPSIYTLAMVIAPKGREAQVLGYVLAGWTVSMVLGVSVSAWATDLAGWRAVYGALSGVALVLWGAARALRGAGSPSGQATSPLTALRVPGITGGLLATALLMLGFYSSYFFTGAHIAQALGHSTTQAGLLPLFYGIGFGLAVLLDPLLDRLGLARATPPVFLGVTASYLLMMVWADQYMLLLGLAVLWGICQHLALNLVVARVTQLDPQQRGAIMGLFSTVTYLCVFAAPFCGAAAYAGWGLAGCLAVSALLSACAALESLGLRRKRVSPDGAPA
ncbi:MFS transporter [Leisingera sp. M527]|uniref:MFS transporter n=1 Tax=Leisingera sp. M527 TaxID=2867014 RepID=UPI0021A83C25|nr:MFS transporter [Leisingera sp. M527]UWQ34305.1 MFS transporter [Leisingera sp. M527]